MGLQTFDSWGPEGHKLIEEIRKKTKSIVYLCLAVDCPMSQHMSRHQNTT